MTELGARFGPEGSDRFLVTFAVWLCLLPVLLLVAVPAFGWTWALALAAVALVSCLAVCAAGLRRRGAGGER